MEPLDKERSERVEARVADFGETQAEGGERRATGDWLVAVLRAQHGAIITRPEPTEDAPAQSTSGSAARNQQAQGCLTENVMARYYIETAHFLDKIWYPAGATIDWDGPPSEHMIPIEEWKPPREGRGKREPRPGREQSERLAARDHRQHAAGEGRDGWPRGAGGSRCAPERRAQSRFRAPNLSADHAWR
jgi:hypothetical protein